MLNLKMTFISIFSLISLSTHAQFINLDIQDFDGNYESPEGLGSAKLFDIPAPPSYRQRSEIKLFKGNDSYQLDVDGSAYLWEDVPTTLLELEKAYWNDIELRSENKDFSLSAHSLVIEGSSKQSQLSKLALNCLGVNRVHERFSENLLEACLNGRSALDIAHFSSDDKSQNLYQDLFWAVNLSSRTKTPSAQQDLKSIKLRVNQQNFDGELETKVVFNTTVKVDGKVFYDNENQRVRLRLDKAKAGFLNVKSRVFEALEKNQSENLQVERPWIIYHFKD